MNGPTRLPARSWLAWSMRTVLLAATTVAAGACGHPAVDRGASAPRPLDNGVDVTSQNLPPDKEIDALLSGKRPGGTVRVAVPPFKVLGAGADWMGEAASLVTMSRLSRESGISVLDRNELTTLIEEIRRNGANDPKSLARAGRLLGAQELLLGSLVEEGKGKMRLIVRPVRVEDGVSVASNESDVRLDQWVDDLETALGAMASSLRPGGGGEEAAAPAQSAPLDGASTEKAGRASALAAKGQLLAAQPLFEQALSRPSSAWGLEAEYVELMNDLGMRAWAADRARSVVARMPRGPATACARARLQIEQTRAEYKLDSAREGLRFAAACGDKVVVARALRVYAYAVQGIDYELARVAYRRALALLGDGDENGWERCWVQEGQYGLERGDGLAIAEGHDADRYEDIAKRCEAAGNLFVAAWSYEEASANAILPSHATELLDRGIAIAERVGGTVHDGLLFNRAAQLRDEGQPSKGDDVILGVMGARLRAIAELAGGLPEIEGTLDEELLQRAGVSDPKARSPGVPDGAKLLVQAHRIALASAVRKWADRTDPESARQAKAYRAVADQLDPPRTKVPDGETTQARFERRLTEAGVSLKQLAEEDAAPPRATITSLEDAHDALWDRFWELRGAKAPQQELRRVVDAIDKVGRWHGSPRLQGNAHRLEARLSADTGHGDDALAWIRKAHQKMTSAPWYELGVMADEAEYESDPAKARTVRDARPAVAKNNSLTSWVDALQVAVREDSKVDHAACRPGVDALVAAARELEDEGARESAAYALAQAAFTANECESSDGTARAVELQLQRLGVVEKLSDPLRSLQVLGDVLRAYRSMLWQSYRGGTDRLMRSDPRANGLMARIRAGAEGLAKSGRPRDAARVAGNVPTGPEATQALLREALGWTEQFKDSIEYPKLAASLHAQLGRSSTEGDAKVRELTLARVLYRRAGELDSAADAQRTILLQYEGSPLLAREYAKCIDITGSDARYFDRCVSGLAPGLSVAGTLTPFDPALLRSAIKTSIESLPVWDQWNAQYRMGMRTRVATLALAAGDMATFHRFDDEVRTYYTRAAPDAYQLVTHLGGLTDMALAVDPRLFFKLWHDFVDAHGASAFWESGSLLAVAQEARRLKDPDDERFFLDRGRERSTQNATYAHQYARDGVGAALATKSWALALKKLEAGRRVAAGRPIQNEDYTFAIATVHAMAGDLPAARAALKPVVSRIEGDATSMSPCFDAMVLEMTASLAGASHECKAMDEMKQRAEASRARCTGSTDLDEGNWTDEPSLAQERAPARCNARFVPFAMHLKGLGSDEWTAFDRIACDMGEADACTAASTHYRFGRGVPADPALAASLAKKGCDGGNLAGCAQLAELLAEGAGVSRDAVQARELARRTCERGGAWACQVEGDLVQSGAGGPADPAGALTWYDRGCKQHDAASCEAVAEAEAAR